jgi:hypothetical protein
VWAFLLLLLAALDKLVQSSSGLVRPDRAKPQRMVQKERKNLPLSAEQAYCRGKKVVTLYQYDTLSTVSLGTYMYFLAAEVRFT